ncbi:MAG: Lrp/AsnC family transcriptional regulator [Gemmatimonadota bacterium]|nr:Lrp/AsnC family transcriptional regulator [Gemmatimonadota bacterium]MDE3172447.1 Lrp/AsnC family transcriptional regulator [Gemmatimonadota bacterium]MDE3214869.1 Lrp/AsnC family transcriptional regulator [Gemmatimonadota bacterium]
MPSITVDAVDFKALSRLQQFGRDSWKRLGDLLGLTPQAAADRVRRLEQSGVIQGYAAVVDPDAVGIHMLAFVAVSLERPRNREQFLSRVASLSEVQECHHISGDFDYLLKIRCRNTVDLERLIGEEIKGLGGVGASRTIVALRTVKETTILPLVTGPVQG